MIHYLEWSIPELLGELARTQAQMGDLYEDLARAKVDELEGKAQGWSQSMETTVRGKEKASNFAAASASMTRYETEGKLDALREQKEFLSFLIDIKSREFVHA